MVSYDVLNELTNVISFKLFLIYNLYYIFHYHLSPYVPCPQQSAHCCSWAFFPFCSIPPPPKLSSTPLAPLPPLTIICSPYMSLSLFFLLVQFVHRFHIWVKSYGICLSLTGLLHLAKCSLGPSILLQRVKFSSFLQLNSIPLCKCPMVILSTHLLVDTQAASMSWRL